MPVPMPRMNMPQQKEKADLKYLGKIFMYCKNHSLAFVISIIFAASGVYTSVIGPEKISELMNLITGGIVGGIDIDTVVNVSMTLAAIYVIGSILRYAQHFITATISQKAAKSLRMDINQKLNKLPLRYFDRTTKGDLLSRVTNDVDTIGQTLGNSMANLVSSATLFVGVIFKMLQSNWALALTTIISSVIGFVVTALIVGKSQKFFNRKQTYLGDMNGQIEEVYTNHNIVNAFGGKDNEVKKFNKTNDILFESDWKSQFLSGMMHPVMSFVGNLSYVMIFVVGVAFIVNGNDTITLGTLISFVIYSRLFSQPLTTFAQSMNSLQQTSAASKRVFELLGEKEMPDETKKTTVLRNVDGNVEFRNVHFGYDQAKPIIHDFSAKLKKGQKVAIVGPTGAGKSTIVNLLMRFYDVQGGDILIDGVSIQKLKRENVHDLFDMILQDTWLFEGTVRENLVYNTPNVTDKQLDKVCQAVGLDHFVKTLSHRYDTVLNDSVTLSEGQKQQLTIARAMINNSPMLILDEATSSVDTRTELVIQDAMDKLTEGRTSFVIAHRLSTIKNADVILVMRNGDIVEQGNHESLLKQNGFYAELYNSQFESNAG